MARRSLVFPRALLALALVAGPLFGYAPAAQAIANPPLIQQDEPVDVLDGVESAVIQIEAVGSFVDPSEGQQQNVPGFGSGFIIDESGIAVTNNHVVTGGALFRVYVSGRDEPVNAKVLGVSECSDLAVIDLQGGGYPYLSWREGTPRVGLDVYAAGFPLGDPEFTLTKGIISKANANGESNWASLDSVLMHDATINPGNSGGPLVDENGAIVGVNYASNSDTNQYFAIPGGAAQDVIAQLREGFDVDSLGINGEAFETEDDLSGIWIYSVASGSPADVAGIEPGDILTEIEGLAVGGDGIMLDYCDIVASHDATDVLSFQVYREATDEVLEGQFNGRSVAPSFSIADEVEQDIPLESSGAAAADNVYVPLADAANVMHIEVPDTWAEVEEKEWKVDDEPRGTQLVASTDLSSFYDSWGIPGVVFSYSPDLQNDWEPEALLDTLDYSEQCTYVGRSELPEDAYFLGFYDEYEECGESDTAALVAAMIPKTGDYMLGVEVYAVSEADLDALDHILDTFYIETGVGAPVASGEASVDIFDLVDVSGLEYEYSFLNEEYFSALVPAQWTDVVSEDWLNDDDELLGKIVVAAEDVQKYRDDWAVPGVQVYLITELSEDFSVQSAMDAADFSDDCTYEERKESSHTIYELGYSGEYDIYSDCDGSGNLFYTAVMLADSGDHAYFIDFVSMEDADDEAFEVLMQSFFLGSAAISQVNNEAYTIVSDDSGLISLSVPNAWTDIESGPWEVDDEVVGTEMTVAPDVDDFNSSWRTPGAYVGVWEEFGSSDPDEVLDTLTFEDECEYDTRYEYEDAGFTGKYDFWKNCGNVSGLVLASFALTAADNPDRLIVLQVVMPTEEDIAALEPILNTLAVGEGGASPAAPAEEPTEEPSAEPTPEPADEPVEEPSSGGDEIVVTIVTDTLNVRSGPGTNYARIATVDRDFVLGAVGQWNNCAWLLVEDQNGEQGWVSGDPSFTTLEGDCADVPAAEAPAAPAANSSGNAGSAARSGQGCVTFKNQVGIELNITWTRQSDNWNTTYTIAKGASGTRCLDPGSYTYTASTWDGRSINDSMQIAAGDNVNIDLNP